MCLLCVEIQKQKMTVKEVARAYCEFDFPQEHTSEISDVIKKNYDMGEVIEALINLYKKEKK